MLMRSFLWQQLRQHVLMNIFFMRFLDIIDYTFNHEGHYIENI